MNSSCFSTLKGPDSSPVIPDYLRTCTHLLKSDTRQAAGRIDIVVNNLNNHPPHQLLTRKEAALHLGMSGKTLANWAVLGKGPAFHSYGDGWVRYSMDDLTAWVASTRTEMAA